MWEEKLVDPKMPRENFIANKKNNFKKNVVIFTIFSGSLIYFLWSIAMFSMNLDQFVSYKWIINTSTSIFIDLTITPFIKTFIVLVVLGWIQKKINQRKELNKMKVAKVESYDGEINIYSSSESQD